MELQIGWVEAGLALSLLVLSYCYFSWTSAYAYWKRRNVPYLKPTFPFGNFNDVLLSKKNFRNTWLDLYNAIGNRPFCGIYLMKTPILVFKDPELIKLILTKDFSYFTDHGWLNNMEHEPLFYNIFFMKGDVWKNFRSLMAPAFSSGKMKMMFPIMNGCANQLRLSLDHISKGSGTFEVKNLMQRYTLDTISNAVFGVSSACVNEPDCGVYKVGKQIFERSFKYIFSNLMLAVSPKIYSLLKLHFMGYEASKYFANLITDSIEYRERTHVTRNDFVDILVRLKNNLSIDDADMFSSSHSNKKVDTEDEKSASGITLDSLLAQALTFYIAGLETTAGNISFCLYELSMRPDVQLKIQEEIDEALQRNGGFTYQMIQELPYLDNVINETLRRYNTLSTSDRVCVKPYKIPDTDIVIDKGCKVAVISAGLHHDPNYFPDPLTFDPNRFLEENVRTRPLYTFMPFGEGPRMCIGWRFARMQMRLGLATFFSEFNCKLNPRTRVPLTFASWEILTVTRDDILIDISRRNSVIDSS